MEKDLWRAVIGVIEGFLEGLWRVCGGFIEDWEVGGFKGLGFHVLWSTLILSPQSLTKNETPKVGVIYP